ncbi:PREDICTED: uncharacterized protein LOC104605047 [Nelumbo nucifera]|uniref:Uncharacterized protein LOC104605047 n=2 Tax=Nelumbo nucifera TaxID=4432 RepID=A0A1U8AXA1_NELNU|nr:PREDICTED: uncharacterized protein LOC104605047 [Nelumbo nucifera]DAD41140.1 TPA_asm: hypothetical protein HUJ06_015463 [Nelumbo nucifera]
MVSFQNFISVNQRNTMPELENSSKKRRWEKTEDQQDLEKRPKLSKAVVDIELQLERPLPVEWQRCLDIKSGEIHFYNTRTQMRTCKDPRQSPERSSSPRHISLDLELNLTCEPVRSQGDDDNWIKPAAETNGLSHNSDDQPHQSKNCSSGVTRTPSWMSLEADDEQEMVAAVCKRCHMLVMLCKSSPACPNCKFMHPPDQTPNLFKPRIRLLCCKD